mgnify:CR=1 FL=1
MQHVVLEGRSVIGMAKIVFGCTPGLSIRAASVLICINDITDGLESMPFVYADDTTLFEVVDR